MEVEVPTPWIYRLSIASGRRRRTTRRIGQAASRFVAKSLNRAVVPDSSEAKISNIRKTISTRLSLVSV